jgi:hypothetical protein
MTIKEIHAIETRITRDKFYSWTRTNIYRIVSDDPWEDPRKVAWVALSGEKDEDDPEPIEFDPADRKWQWGSGDSFQFDDTRELYEIDARLENPLGQRTGNRLVWIVTMTFRDWEIEHDGQKRATARMIGYHPDLTRPWQMPVRWGGSLMQQEETVSLTVDDTAMINSADQPYAEQRVQKDYGTVIMACALKRLSAVDRMQGVNTINSSTFWDFPVATLKLAKWAFETKYWRNSLGVREPYVNQVIEFHAKQDTWDIFKPDYGTVTKEQGTGNPDERYQTVDFSTTDNGLAWGTNVRLDGSGKFATSQTGDILTAQRNGPFSFYESADYHSGFYPNYIPQLAAQTIPPQFNFS